MNKFVKVVKPANIYKEFLNSLNGILHLTPKGLDILAKIIELNPKATDQSEYSNAVSLPIRRKIIKDLHINKANLSNYIFQFFKANLLIKDPITKAVHINKALFPIIEDNRVIIQMIIDIKDESK